MIRSVDASGTRDDLASRREMKFRIAAVEVDFARRCLASNGRRICHQGEVSVVRSIYFDDPSLSACHANLDGLARRQKLRLRWYDSTLPSGACFLELKWRNNRITGKHRLKIEWNSDWGKLEYRQLLANLAAQSATPFSRALAKFTEPILLVEYRREHFLSRDGRLRATLDYGLTFYDQMNKRSISTAFPIVHPNFAVIEGKTAIGEEAAIRSLLYPMKLRASRSSKYVQGCRALGLVYESV